MSDEKLLTAFLGYLLFSSIGWAQTTTPAQTRKPDLIFKKDKAVLEVRIEQLTFKGVRYHLAANPNSSLREIPINEVAKIRFADGTEKVFTQLQTAALVAEPKPVSSPALSIEARRQPGAPFLTLAVGGEGTYLLGAPSWVADSAKTGFRFGAGVSAALDVHLTNWLAISIGGGLNRYIVERRFFSTESIAFLRTTTTFQQIPIHLGLKLYPAKQIYFMPEAGIQLLTYSYKDGTDLGGASSSQRLAYGGSIGTEFGSRTLWFDLSAKYHVVQAKSIGPSFAAIEPVYYTGIRLGMGFTIRK